LDKVKWGLRTVTLACILVPLLCVVAQYAWTGDPLGLIVPPQLRALMRSASSGAGGDLNSTLVALGINPSGLEMPRFEGLTFDDSTKTAILRLKITNPLARQSITINQLSLTVKNGTRSFTIQLRDRVVIGANYAGALSLSFSSSDPDALKSLVNIINGVEKPAYAGELQLSELYVDVNGISIRVSDLGKISELFGESSRRS